MSREAEIFAAAIELAGPERAAFLESTCTGDSELRARIEALLRGHERAVRVFATPILDPALPRGAAEAPGDVIGRFTLREKIGEGGCGVVWMAEQLEPVRRRVALKVIKLGMDTREVIARFEAERQALALMEHPHIARVFDGGATDTGRPFFVMEWVRGVPITRYCAEHRLELRARIELFIAVCEAVQHAHQKGIIHRDLKPANILVEKADTGPVPKIIDFGIAKAMQGKLTDATAFTLLHPFIGTPAYMSPEQTDLNAVDIDTRSDIYSLGVLLYELIAGRPPVEPQTLARSPLEEIRRLIREVDPPPPSAVAGGLATGPLIGRARPPDFRGELDWITMTCLEKDRTRRYQTVNGLARDLQRYLHDEPVSACPPGRTYLLRKFVCRHRAPLAASVAIGFALVLGATVSTWQALRATRAEQEQIRSRQRAEAQELAARRRAYASDMNLVQQALAEDHLGRARQLLDRQRPQAGESDLRDWEWRHLWQFCGNESESTLERIKNSFDGVAASPDARWLAAISVGGFLTRIWNVNTGASTDIAVPGFHVNRLAFSPDGTVLALAAIHARRTHVVLWHLHTRHAMTHWIIDSDGAWCTGLFFSADGKTLVTSTGSEQNRISLWDVSTGRARARYPTAPGVNETRYAPFAVSADFKVAAYSSFGDGRFHVIDLSNGHTLWSTPEQPTRVMALAFSPDGRTLASGGGFHESPVRLWDVASGTERGRLEGNHRGITQLVFWPDGRTLASAGVDQTVRLWDVENRRLKRTLRGHTGEVYCLTLLPDNKTLASGSKNGELLLWNSMTSDVPREFTLAGPIKLWRFSQNGDALITVDAAGRVVGRSGPEFREEKTLLQLKPPVWAADTIAATLSQGVRGGTVLATHRARLAHASEENRIEVWDWERGGRLAVIIAAAGERLAPVGFDGAGDRLFVSRLGSAGVTREEWNVASGSLERSWKPTVSSRPGAVLQVVMSPDARRLISILSDSALMRTDLDTGTETQLELDLLNTPTLGAFSADGSMFVSHSWSGVMQIVQVEPLKHVTTVSAFLAGAIHSAAFSPNGRRLATGAGSREAMVLWDVGSYERVLAIPAAESIFRHAAFSPDGRLVGALGGLVNRASLYFWRAPSWSEIDAAEAAEAQRRTGQIGGRAVRRAVPSERQTQNSGARKP